MAMTLNEYYNSLYDEYYIILDNKGNFKYGKGIVPYQVVKQTEDIMKQHIRNRKTDLRLKVLWNKREHCVQRIDR